MTRETTRDAVSLASMLHEAARRYASAICAVDGDRQLTFREVEARSNRLANALVALSPAPRGRVALMLPNSIEFLESDLAVVKAVKAKVPINTRLTVDERLYVLRDSGADVLVTDAPGAELLLDHGGDLPGLSHVLVVGNDAPRGTRSYEVTLSEARPEPPGLSEDEESPSVILYTSGTTGWPKGAVASFESRTHTIFHMLLDELEIVPGDGMVHAGSMAHGSGSKSVTFWLRGARNLFLRKFDPEAFVRLVNGEQATNSFLVPTMIADLLEAVERQRSCMPSLKTISYGGAPIHPELLQRALSRMGGIFVQVYGSCEAPHPLTVLTKTDHAVLSASRLASIGRPVMGVELKLVDGDGSVVREGQPGEMLVRGASLMTGYWQNSEATDAAFLNGFYRTGDVATRDEEGYYYIVDRQREMIITGGLNVYPAEVERVLATHPKITEAAVIGVPDERWVESVVAFVIREDSDDLSANDVIEYCKKRLAGYKKPRAVEFVDDLPRGSTGKVLKRALREPYWLGRERRVL